MFEHYNLQGQYLLSFYWLLYLISLCCAGVSGVYTQQAHLCCFSVWIKLLVMGYNDTCDSTVLLRIKLNIYWLHATAVSKSQSYFLVRHVNKPINKRAHTQKKYPLGRGCQTQTWIKGQASPVLHSELEKKQKWRLVLCSYARGKLWRLPNSMKAIRCVVRKSNSENIELAVSKHEHHEMEKLNLVMALGMAMSVCQSATLTFVHSWLAFEVLIEMSQRLLDGSPRNLVHN